MGMFPDVHKLPVLRCAERAAKLRDVIHRADMESTRFVCLAVLASPGVVAGLWDIGGRDVERGTGADLPHHGDAWRAQNAGQLCAARD